MTNTPPPKVCVIGWPINHSRSPLIHNYWLSQNHIAGKYEAVAVPPENLAPFLKNLKSNGYVGCNVTLPHKQSAIQHIKRLDSTIIKTGSLNTVYFENDTLCATSTDGQGFIDNVLSTHPDFKFVGAEVLLIGAGGSARAIIHALLENQVKVIHVNNRTPTRVEELSQIFGKQIIYTPNDEIFSKLPNTDLLINTTSQGMIGQPPLVIELDHIKPSAIIADIVYIPLKTNLITQAERLGLRFVPGLGMLLHQAVVGFEKWFGIKPKVTAELYELIANDISGGQKP